jgi:hypothetical protein
MDPVPASDVERRAARLAQQQVELRRLAGHRQLGTELLAASPAEQRKLIDAALREVDRWESQQLCSVDYIESWRTWLALPVELLVPRMCSDLKWAYAMRQNSPFTAVMPVLIRHP